MGEIVTKKDKAKAREEFENHIRFAFARIEHHVDDDEDSPEVLILFIIYYKNNLYQPYTQSYYLFENI